MRSNIISLVCVATLGTKNRGTGATLVHKVEPGASSQVVLIVDWGVEKEA